MAEKKELRESEEKDALEQGAENRENRRRDDEPESKRKKLKSDTAQGDGATAPTSIVRRGRAKIFDEFMAVMNDPLLDLNDSCSAHKELKLDFHNFRPRRVMELLVDRASSTNTSPKEFLEEIQSIIHSRFGGDPEDSDVASVDRNRLEVKYAIAETGSEPDVITPSRLCFTFPQFAVAIKKSSIVAKIRSLQMEYSSGFIDIPPLFYLPEFSGLIPSKDILEREVREALITLHVYALYKLNQPEPFQNPVSVYARQMLLKRGIATGLLSNEQRLYYLLLNRVIVSDRELSYSAEKAYRELVQSKSSFTRQINFNLID